MIKKYTHIFFDLDNTLWDFNKNSRNAMLSVFNHFKLETFIDFNLFFETYSKHNHLLWDSYRKGDVIKKDLTRLRFQNTFDELELKDINADLINTLYLEEMPKQTALNEGVFDLLTYLKKKQYNLNIITNGFKEVQFEKIKTSGLSSFFNKVFISEEIKSPKPEKEIFEYSIKSSNAVKKKSIMVGDDWDVDVMGAVNFGIDAVHFNKINGTLKKSINPINNCKIYSVEKLIDLNTIF